MLMSFEDVTKNVFYWSRVAIIVAQGSGMHRRCVATANSPLQLIVGCRNPGSVVQCGALAAEPSGQKIVETDLVDSVRRGPLSGRCPGQGGAHQYGRCG